MMKSLSLPRTKPFKLIFFYYLLCVVAVASVREIDDIIEGLDRVSEKLNLSSGFDAEPGTYGIFCPYCNEVADESFCSNLDCRFSDTGLPVVFVRDLKTRLVLARVKPV